MVCLTHCSELWRGNPACQSQPCELCGIAGRVDGDNRIERRAGRAKRADPRERGRVGSQCRLQQGTPGKRDGDPFGEAFEVAREVLNGGVDEPRVWHPAAFLRACCGLCGFSQTIERRIDADDQLAGPGAGRVQRRAPVSSAEVNGQPLRVGRQEVQDGLTVDNADALALYHAHGQTPRVIEAKCSAPAHCLPPCLAHHVELREECRSPDRLTWYG